MSRQSTSVPSVALVAVQGLCMAGLAYLSCWWPWRPLPLALAAAGTGLGVWAVAVMRPAQLRILPEVGARAELRIRGPYAAIRHPMYAAVLLATLALLLQRVTAAGAALWLLLLADLLLKMRREERFLLARFPEYGAYRKRTRRLVPGLF